MALTYVILYCDGAATPDDLPVKMRQYIANNYTTDEIDRLRTIVKRKGSIPVLQLLDKDFDFIKNYWKLAQQGGKYLYMLYVDYDKRFKPVKDWMDTQSGLLYWHGNTMIDACKALWAERAQQPQQTILKYILRVPVTTEVDGQQVTRNMIVIDAENAGETVTVQDITDAFRDNPRAVIPMEVYNG